jgi:hypothetical protein
MRMLAAVALLGCAGLACSESEAAPQSLDVAPRLAIARIEHDQICPTRGQLAPDKAGVRVDEATFRAVAPGSGGDAARVRFVYRGDTQQKALLASSQLRRQLGLKLRAVNGCNLVYVMWRLDPKPGLEVSIKRNPGAKTNEDCGNRGYTRIKPTRSTPVPMLDPGTPHTLQAEIVGDELIAWVDDKAVWRGKLDKRVRQFRGPAGLRSDNAVFEIEEFSAPVRLAKAECPKKGEGD